MGFTKPIEQYLFCNLLTKIHVFMYLKDIIRGEWQMESLIVNTSPSKKYFIDMITKDVSAESCILDLIDNSIDAHKKNYMNGESEIRINFSVEDDFFSITDDCGGMSKDIAIHKAFRFGNSEIRTSGTLGMYGIGMKRSIFKIGKDFEVKSKCKEDSFKVYMTQDEWLTLKTKNEKGEPIDDWKFYLEDEQYSFKDGVHIHIKKLNESIISYLKYPRNIKSLKDKISNSYHELLEKGVSIYINNERVIYMGEDLFESNILKSDIEEEELGDVSVKLIIGVGSPNPQKAGWNIICNGRTIIANDKTQLTGWAAEYSTEEDSEIDDRIKSTDKVMPVFHNDFARFRGFVYLNSNDATQLPLNTTKDGIDLQHPIYEYIYEKMIDKMKIVLPKLRGLQEVIRNCKKESTVPPTNGFIVKPLDELYEIKNQRFSLELENYKAVDKIKNIPMYIDEKTTVKLKRYFEASTNKELGEKIYSFVMGKVLLDE